MRPLIFRSLDTFEQEFANIIPLREDLTGCINEPMGWCDQSYFHNLAKENQRGFIACCIFPERFRSFQLILCLEFSSQSLITEMSLFGFLIPDL